MTQENLKDIIKEEIRQILFEVTAKELRTNATDGFLNIRTKSKGTPGTYYKGITKEGLVYFITPSHNNNVRSYIQTIELLDFDKYLTEFQDTLQPIEIVRKIIAGDIKVHCTDPSWLYWGFQYKGTKNGYARFPENRPPKIRNPKLQGSTCKHIDNALLSLPFVATRITSDLMKLGIFKRKAVKLQVPISTDINS